ncbi:MAG: hypothetical protein ABW003_09230 [Microvirga sp.]
MKKPLKPWTKAFQQYEEWLVKQLVEEIWLGASLARDDGWLREAVQSVAKIDPDISDDMVREAMRRAIRRNRESIARNQRWIVESRAANAWIEQALNEPRSIEVMASPETAALFSAAPSAPSEAVLLFRSRHTED